MTPPFLLTNTHLSLYSTNCPVNFSKPNSYDLCLAATDTRGPCSLEASQRRWRMALRRCEGGQALQEERERQRDLCVIRPAVVIHRVWMLLALCADRDKRLSWGLIGLFTSYNWEGGCVCMRERETQSGNLYDAG